MIMIRNTMFGLSLLALTAGSAFAAPVAKHHVAKVRTVASAPAGDAAPAADKAAKPEKKAHKGKKATKEAPKAEVKAPAPETK
jgi:hypothetical protein